MKSCNEFNRYSSDSVIRPKMMKLDSGVTAINSCQTRTKAVDSKMRYSPKRNPTHGVSLKELTSIISQRSTTTVGGPGSKTSDQLVPVKSVESSIYTVLLNFLFIEYKKMLYLYYNETISSMNTSVVIREPQIRLCFVDTVCVMKIKKLLA